MKRIQIALLVLLVLSSSGYAEDRRPDENSAIAESSTPRIVTGNCDESLAKVLQEVIKHYVDLGDLDSAGVLLQLAKNSHLAVPRLHKTLETSSGKKGQMNEVYRYWGLGSF